MGISTERFDLAVIGGGSGGIGAAIAGARMGLHTLLVERSACLGGNAVSGGVHNWEPGVGGTGLAMEIYHRLLAIPHAVGITGIGRHCLWKWDARNDGFPGGELLIQPRLGYGDTLRRFGAIDGMRDSEGFCRRYWHSVVFEPDAYVNVVGQMLHETGQCTLRVNTSFTGVHMENGRLRSVTLNDGSQIEAEYFVDATADANLAVACGCATMSGQESTVEFGEQSAAAESSEHINGITLIFRISRQTEAAIEPLPADVPPDCWWAPGFPGAAFTQYPNGDFNVNMLPTMEGREFLSLSYALAYKECRRRVQSFWHCLQSGWPEFARFRLSWIAPALGVRETRRMRGRYVLTESDLRSGLSRQTHPDIIAIADHAMDMHGQGNRHGGCGELAEPYGIPYRCLLPEKPDNLLVACRAASFSSIAASSCRLSRTMLALGQAVGTAAALANRRQCELADVPSELLRQELRRQFVQLSWPMPDGLLQRVSANEVA